MTGYIIYSRRDKNMNENSENENETMTYKSFRTIRVIKNKKNIWMIIQKWKWNEMKIEVQCESDNEEVT